MKVKCYNRNIDSSHVEIDSIKLSVCRVCGYDFEDWFPWGKEGVDPTFAICPCCNVEFGYEDCSIEAVIKFRNEWIENGAYWSQPEKKPDNWSLNAALDNIPDVFKLGGD